jgi:hydrogenase maturation protein HypF
VSSLLCIRHVISYDSQAAMELEAVGTSDIESVQTVYPYDIVPVTPAQDGVEWIIDIIPGIREIVNDIQAGVPAAKISHRFHQTLVHGFSRTAGCIAAAHGVNKVVLSGGVFQNDLILNDMMASLKKENLCVYTHSLVPSGDGGISLGQVAVAGAKWGRHPGFSNKNDTPAEEVVSWD